MELPALGPNKRKLAGVLLRRLRDRFAPGGLLHFGQGKWYPGESLPRWALGCYWRRDGVAVWQDQGLIADDGWDYRHGDAEARRFSAGLAARLGVDPAHLIPGYEDAWYYLWRERQLPVNVDPLKSNLDDPEERAPPGPRLRAGSEQGRRLRPAAAPGGDGEASLGQRPLVPAPRGDVSDPRRFADGLPPAAGFVATGRRGGPAAVLPAGPRGAARPAAAAARSPAPVPIRMRPLGDPARPAVGERPGRRRRDPHQRCAWNRATAGCTSSCRRCASWRSTSTSSPPSKTRPPSWACRCWSKATRRRTTTASSSSS